MDKIVELLKSDKHLDENDLKEIRNKLILRPMYEWYVDTDGDESLDDYFKILEDLCKIIFIEQKVLEKCDHVFLWDNEENNYRCIRCGCHVSDVVFKECILPIENLDYRKACALYDEVVKTALIKYPSKQIIEKILSVYQEKENIQKR